MDTLVIKFADGDEHSLAVTPALLNDARKAHARGQRMLTVPIPSKTCDCCGESMGFTFAVADLLNRHDPSEN